MKSYMNNYLESVIKQVDYYRMLGEKAIDQVPDEKLFWKANEESNSVATIAKHLWGNMMSRWTNFLTSDGEKEWRNRDAEFDNDITSRVELIQKWNEGWQVCLSALKTLSDADLEKTIYIRNQGHTVMEAINRQLSHYPYHIGQIVFIAKIVAHQWQSLSIPKGNSSAYNNDKFAKDQHPEHFSDEYRKK